LDEETLTDEFEDSAIYSLFKQVEHSELTGHQPIYSGRLGVEEVGDTTLLVEGWSDDWDRSERISR
jgi:hypothetical protein